MGRYGRVRWSEAQDERLRKVGQNPSTPYI
eukprot:COSAG02_NODE_59415_length_274_cov_0.857143_1_plen_29_part_10